MADAGHLKELRKGALHWNHWRLANPHLIPDLEGCALEAVFQNDGSGHDTPLNFLNANIKGATLSNAKLTGADLKGADLSGADLRGAQLQDADLSFADISTARFAGADVQGAKFFKADVRGADLSGVLNLTTSRIEQAQGDERTRLPADIQTPKSWQNPTLKNINFEDFNKSFPVGSLSQDPHENGHIELVSKHAQQQGYTRTFLRKATTQTDFGDPERVVTGNAPYNKDQGNDPHKKSALGLIAVLLVCVIGVAMAGGFWAMNMAQKRAHEQADFAAWSQAQVEATATAFQEYLANHPDGKYVVLARKQVSALEAAAMKKRADDEAWALAKRSGTTTALKGYLTSHPDGGYVAAAREQVAALEAAAMKKRAYDEAWAKLKEQETATNDQIIKDRKPVTQESTTENQARRKTRKKSAKVASRTVKKKKAKAKNRNKPKNKPSNPWPTPDEPFLGLGFGF